MVKLGYIIANRAIFEGDEAVGYLYREQPDNEGDSGWRVFTGRETQQEADDAANFAMYNASTVVERAPEIASLLARAAPAAFERDEDGAFVEIDETDPDDP